MEKERLAHATKDEEVRMLQERADNLESKIFSNSDAVGLIAKNNQILLNMCNQFTAEAKLSVLKMVVLDPTVNISTLKYLTN